MGSIFQPIESDKPSNLDSRKDSVRITLKLNPDTVARKLQVLNAMRPYLKDPLASSHNIVDYGFAQLGWQFGWVTMYTDVRHLQECLDNLCTFLRKVGAPLQRSGEPTVLIEFRHSDAPSVRRWLEHKNEALNIINPTVVTDFGQAYTVNMDAAAAAHAV